MIWDNYLTEVDRHRLVDDKESIKNSQWNYLTEGNKTSYSWFSHNFQVLELILTYEINIFLMGIIVQAKAVDWQAVVKMNEWIILQSSPYEHLVVYIWFWLNPLSLQLSVLSINPFIASYCSSYTNPNITVVYIGLMNLRASIVSHG